MRKRALAPAVLLCLTAGCSPPAAIDSSLMRVSLPLGMESAELRRLTLTQLGEVQQLDLPADGSATARVIAGVPVDVSVTVLGVEAPSSFRAYTASRRLVPAAGATALDLELEASEDRAGSAVPAFVVGGVAHPFDTTVTITDVETGHRLAGLVPRTGEAFALPAGRLVELAAASPTDPGGVVTITLLGSDFAADTPIPLIAPSTDLASLHLAAGSPTDVNAAIAGLPLALSCTEAPTCPAGATYSATLPLVPALERTYALGCRYAGAPDLCVPLEVVVDSTAPALELSATPPYLPPAGGPVTLAIHAAEALDPATLEVTVGGATACAPAWAGEADASCVIDAALLAADPTDVTVTAADACGNPATAVLRLRGGVDGSGLALTGVRTFPSRPDPTGEFLVGFDVVGVQPCVGSVPVLLQGLATDNPPAGVAAAPSLPIDPSLLTITQPATTVDLSAGAGGTPARVTLWASVTGGGTLLPGTYGMTLTTDGSCGADVATFDVALVPPPPRWITTNGVLVFAERTGGGARSGFAFPVGPGSSLGWLTSDPAVVAIETANGLPVGAQVVGPGRAVVTVTPSPTDLTPASAAIFEIAPGPGLALLQDDGAPVPRGWVLVADASTSERIDLDPAIGAPLRLLWDPGRDALVAVGSAGVEDLGASPPAVLGALPATALDAALVPDAGGGAGSVVLLLDKALVVTADLATGAVAAPVALDTTGCTMLPTRLAYGAVGGEITLLGGDCPRALRFEGGAWRERPLRLAPANPTATASDARSDLVVLVDGKSAAWSVLTAGAGSSTAAYVDPRTQAAAVVDAVAVDGGSGRPVLAAYDGLSGSTTILTCSRGDPSGCQQSEVPLTGRAARIVVDATSREVIAIGVASPSPTLTALSLDSGMPVPLRVATPAIEPRPVTDAVLRGPQVLSVSPHSVAPGGVVTIVGTGFAAGGRDEVFVQGVRAETLQSTPTLVVARVPPALAAWRATSPAVIGVRSHGRLVQTAPLLSLVSEPPTLEATPGMIATCTTSPCPSSYEQPTALVTDDGTQLVSYPTSGLFDTWLYPVLSGPVSSPVVMTEPVVLGASRVVGRLDELDPTSGALTGRSWVEFRPDGAESRSVAIDQGATFASVGPIAADPTERLLAIVADGAIRLYRAATYAEAAAPAKLASGNVGLAFTRDGRGLVALGTVPVPGYDGLQLSAEALDVSGDLTLATAPPGIAVGFDPTCPTKFVSSPRLLSGSGPTPESMHAVYDWSEVVGGATTLVVATLAPGTVTIQGVPREGLVFTCTPTAVASSGIGTAAVTASGRLLAVGMSNEIVVLSPAAPRVSGPVPFATSPSSVAFAPEPPTGSGTLVTAFGWQTVEIDTLLTR